MRPIRYKVTYRRGLIAESLASLLLLAKGYHIRARRCRTPYGEIDLIATRGKYCIFIEVKARPDTEKGLFAIRPDQQERIERAALHFLQQHPALQQREMRFDVITCSPRRMPHHHRDAWRPTAF